MHDLKAVSTLFDLRGDFVHGYSYGSGHINDTYCIWVDQAGQRIRYILQRVNHNVFKQPIPLMENVKRVTDHALKRLKEEQCPEQCLPTTTTSNEQASPQPQHLCECACTPSSL